MRIFRAIQKRKIFIVLLFLQLMKLMNLVVPWEWFLKKMFQKILSLNQL